MKTDVVLVKLGGVFVIIYALNNLSFYVSYTLVQEFPAAAKAIIFALVFLLPLLIAWVLWKFPATLVSSVNREEEVTDGPPESVNRLLLVGLMLLGVFLFVTGILDLVYFESANLVTKFTIEDQGFSRAAIDPYALGTRLTYVLKMIFGAILIYGRNGLSTFLRQVRSAGMRPK